MAVTSRVRGFVHTVGEHGLEPPGVSSGEFPVRHDHLNGTLFKIDAAGRAVDTLVNCAGAGSTKSFIETTLEELDMQIQLDIGAVVEISHPVASGQALVNAGSLTGYMPVPMMAAYAAVKSFVIRFTEALSHELRDSSLQVMDDAPPRGPDAHWIATPTRYLDRDLIASWPA